MTDETDTGPVRERIELPGSARALAADLVLALRAVIRELNEDPQSAEAAKTRHELILKNIRSLGLLVALEEKLEKRNHTNSGGEDGRELDLDHARSEIANRIARLAAAGKN